MKLHESIKSIYDRADNLPINQEWTICERDSGASFRQLKIQDIQSNSYCIDQGLYKNCFGKIFNKSGILKDLDCDGWAVINHNSQKHLLFVELKSKFDSTKIVEAYKQALTTLIKGHMLFSLCDGYNIDECEVDVLIVCLPPDESCKVWLAHNLMLMQDSSANLHKECRFAIELFYKKELYTTLKDVSFLTSCDFADSLENLKIHVLLKSPKSVDDSELTLSVNSIIRD